MREPFSFQTSLAWNQLVATYQLLPAQQARFIRYVALLVSWNERMNLTAILDPEKIIIDHFQDSLAVLPLMTQKKIDHVADVGAGAGFPGIPLAIMREGLSVILIEVNSKKRTFLSAVIEELSLTDRVSISDLDWRTFLKKVHEPVDMFVARASLRPDELVRVFSDASNFQQALVVYWASDKWEPSPVELPYLTEEIPYLCGEKKRRLVLFKK